MTGEMKLRQNLKPTTKRRNKEKKKEFKDKRSWKQNERQKKDPWNWEQKNRPRQHLQMTLLMLYYKLLLWYYLVKFFFFYNFTGFENDSKSLMIQDCEKKFVKLKKNLQCFSRIYTNFDDFFPIILSKNLLRIYLNFRAKNTKFYKFNLASFLALKFKYLFFRNVEKTRLFWGDFQILCNNF